MPFRDPLQQKTVTIKKIFYPFQLFRVLSVQEADDLQEELQALYFEQNPGEKRRIIERSKGNPDLEELYSDEAFNRVIVSDYGYDTSILAKRTGDELARRLVEAINEYNVKVERQQKAQPQSGQTSQTSQTAQPPQPAQAPTEQED